MKITISISSYNQQSFLCDAIESALTQTIPCEIVVVDDGSTDNSLKIAQRYEPKIKVISQVNKGLSSARNTGIMNASGDYILFLDSDDILLPNCIERIQEEISKTNADIVAPSLKEFGIGNANVVLLPEVTLEMFKTGQNYLPYFCAIRKSKLLEIGGYSARMTWGYEDMHLWINLLSRGATIKVIQEILVMYRTKEKSMIHEAQAHHGELLAQISKDFPKIYA